MASDLLTFSILFRYRLFFVIILLQLIGGSTAVDKKKEMKYEKKEWPLDLETSSQMIFRPLFVYRQKQESLQQQAIQQEYEANKRIYLEAQKMENLGVDYSNKHPEAFYVPYYYNIYNPYYYHNYLRPINYYGYNNSQKRFSSVRK